MTRRRSSLVSDCSKLGRGEGPRSPLGSRIPLVALIQALAVSEHLNFRRAAAALGMSQSAVSLRIKQLEEDLGVILFERHPHGVRLTEAGRYFLDHVATGIGHLDHAVKTAGAVARGEEGRLRIGLYSSIAAGFLAELLDRFRELHPAVELDLTEGQAREAILRVRKECLDVAFLVGVPELADCHTKPLWTEVLVLAIKATHPLAKADGVRWTDLTEETFLVRYDGSGPQVYDHVVLRLAGNWRQPYVQRCNVGRDTLMAMVAHGYGITLTTEPTTHVHFPGVAFKPILDEPEPLTFSAVWSPHNRSRPLRDLLALAQRKARSEGFKVSAAAPAAPSQTPYPSP